MSRVAPLVVLTAQVAGPPRGLAATSHDATARADALPVATRNDAVLEEMTLSEKIGQMSLVSGARGEVPAAPSPVALEEAPPR